MPRRNPVFTVESIELKKTHKIMDLRLSRGCSAFELSFLLGRKDSFVQDVENPLENPQYSVNDNIYILRIFNTDIEIIMPGKVDPVTCQIKIENTKDKDDLNAYKIIHVLDDGTDNLLRAFTQEDKYIELPFDTKITAGQVSDYVNTLFEEQYFKNEKTALEIFRHCETHFEEPFRPLHLAFALGNFTKRRKLPKLILSKNSFGRTLYAQEP